MSDQKADRWNYYKWNPRLKQLGRKNRKKQTRAERILWYQVLNESRLGVRFIRQRPILNYIVDFMCKELRLIIEVDGGYHDIPEVAEYDAIRQKALEEAGFTVLRFRNEEVYNDLEGVRTRLEQWITARM